MAMRTSVIFKNREQLEALRQEAAKRQMSASELIQALVELLLAGRVQV